MWDGGAAYLDGDSFNGFSAADGLASDAVWEIFQSRDGTVWAGTAQGLSRYDGTTWISYTDPTRSPVSIRLRSIGETTDGTLWMRGSAGARVVRYVPDRNAPGTSIQTPVDRVSSLGSVHFQWTGNDAWNDTPHGQIRYQFRINDDAWSVASDQTAFTFTSISSGSHRLEVRAIDRDGNADPSPATHAFVVEAPWWRNPAVAGPGLLILAFALFQTARVVQGKRKLQESVNALSSANNELFQVNVDLQREQVLERLRGQAQGMQSSEDIKSVVEAVYRELSGFGLRLWSTSIGIHLSETATEIWITDQDGRAQEPFVVENANVELRQAQRRGDEYHHVHYEGEELKRLGRRHLEQAEHVRDHPLKAFPEERWPEKIEGYTAFFEGGRVRVAAVESIDEEYLTMMKRFGEVFAFAHSRYKELQEKEAQNRRLAVEASVQRLRAEVQSMDEASDFERILSLLTESLKTVELSFDGCEIDVLDEPVENPTMELFEQTGFKYATYTLDTDGHVAVEAFAVAAPFPGVIRQTVERFIAGEPWQAVVEEDTTILEVPAGSYGRLRLIATGRERFNEDEIATLREFADAVALGYARCLDIREIQNQTERKSAFLASMSHELRTPMNAIKGFTNVVLRRIGREIPDQQRENLEKVDQASDHLLAMINDLLDLSKIEAGRMDVNATTFNVKESITSACDTVRPLIQEGVELRQDVADDVGEANTDKARVQQMIINLLSNAIKFTDSGSVTVTASRGQGAESGGENLVISVSDTGKGIPADELPTIFDEYRQAEGSESSVQKGTGLGLSITKKFAELLGGTIGVESEVGKGSTFEVRVPVRYSEQ